MTVFAELAACCLIGYLLGNLSPSYVLGKRKGYDVRKDGSGNAGATNTFILMGAKAFFLTTFADILKAYAAYKLCEVFFCGSLGRNRLHNRSHLPGFDGFQRRQGPGLSRRHSPRLELEMVHSAPCLRPADRLRDPICQSCRSGHIRRFPRVPLLADEISSVFANTACSSSSNHPQAPGELRPDPRRNGNAHQLHPRQGNRAQTHRHVERDHRETA